MIRGRFFIVIVAACSASASLAPSGSLSAATAAAPVHKIGHITWHPAKYIDSIVVLSGYLFAREKDYVFFSDESGGKLSAHDLPVSGPGLEELQPGKRYVITGRFLDHGLTARNRFPYHLELTAPPMESPSNKPHN